MRPRNQALEPLAVLVAICALTATACSDWDSCKCNGGGPGTPPPQPDVGDAGDAASEQ